MPYLEPRDIPLDCIDKGVPYGPHGAWNVLADDLHFPLLVLKETALAHNIAVMAEWCRQNGFLLAPHGKTTMCPQLYRRQIEAGAWAITVRQLEQAMLNYLDRRNRKPRPFVWTADADLILGKVARLCKRISNSGH